MTKAHSYLNPGSYLPAFNWVTFNHHACSDCLFRSPPSPHTGRPRPTESKTIPSQPDMFSGLGRAITHKSRSQVYREVKLQLNHLPTLDLVYSVCTLQFSTAEPDSKSVDPRLLVHVHYTVKRPFTWLSYRNTFFSKVLRWLVICFTMGKHTRLTMSFLSIYRHEAILAPSVVQLSCFETSVKMSQLSIARCLSLCRGQMKQISPF